MTTLAWQIVTLFHGLRQTELYKAPGVAETLDWAAGLVALEARELTLEMVEATLGLLLKYQDDLEAVRKGQRLRHLVDQVHVESLDRALQAPEVDFG